MNIFRNNIIKGGVFRSDFTKIHVHKPSESVNQTVTMIPGYGVGQEICRMSKYT